MICNKFKKYIFLYLNVFIILKILYIYNIIFIIIPLTLVGIDVFIKKKSVLQNVLENFF